MKIYKNNSLLNSLPGKGKEAAIKAEKRAFTLVELIVVITILAILGIIAFISLQGYSKDARDSVRVTDIKNTESGLELFNVNAGKYPEPDEITLFTGGTVELKQGVVGDGVVRSIGLDKVIKDPKTDMSYVYSISGNGQYYQLGAEQESDNIGMLFNVFAEDNTVIVRGNYKFDPVLPSLIVVPSSVSGSGIFDPNVCFVMDGGENTFDTCVEKKSEMSLKDYDDGLIGYWDMETMSGTTLLDLSGNGNDGSLVGGLLSGNTGGLVSKGMTFGTGQYVSVANTGEIANMGKLNYDFSISITLRLGDYINGSQPFPIEKMLTSTEKYPILLYYRNSGSMYLRNYFGVGSGGIANKESLVDYQIIYFVVDRKEGKLKYFVDGKIYYIKDIASFGDVSNVENLIIGNRNTSPLLNNWYGVIDDVKIYKRALTEAEVLQQARAVGF